MPFKLIPPRPGKTPFYYIRGTEHGVNLDETTGTASKALAIKFLKRKREAVERGELTKRSAKVKEPETFASVALSYINAGGERRFLGSFNKRTGEWGKGLIPHFGDTLIAEIDQAAIDDAAATLYGDATPATKNRQVYTPVSAVLKHAGIERSIKRPKGSDGVKKVRWLQPDQAFRLLGAASKIDAEFGLFLAFLLYTGCRLSDGLNLTCDRLFLRDAFAYLDETKNDDPRGVFLPPYLVGELAAHPAGLDRIGKVFRFRKNGRLYSLLKKAKAAAGPDVENVSFHTLCHTWATWMRRYGKLDTRGLVGTTRWKDAKSAARYEHVVVSEESQKAALLPTPKRKRNKVHELSTDSDAVFRLRSPKDAG